MIFFWKNSVDFWHRKLTLAVLLLSFCREDLGIFCQFWVKDFWTAAWTVSVVSDALAGFDDTFCFAKSFWWINYGGPENNYYRLRALSLSKNVYLTCSWMFVRLDKLEQFKFKLEKNFGIEKHAGKVRKNNSVFLRRKSFQILANFQKSTKNFMSNHGYMMSISKL